MQQLFLQGKAAMTYNGSWLLPQLQAGTPAVPFDLHVAALPASMRRCRRRSILAWSGFALPATEQPTLTACTPSWNTPAGPTSTGPSSRAPVLLTLPASNAAIHDPVAREFLPMLEDAITSLNWRWEPEIDAEIGSQVQALVGGRTDAPSAGAGHRGCRTGPASEGRSYYP